MHQDPGAGLLAPGAFGEAKASEAFASAVGATEPPLGAAVPAPALAESLALAPSGLAAVEVPPVFGVKGMPVEIAPGLGAIFGTLGGGWPATLVAEAPPGLAGGGSFLLGDPVGKAAVSLDGTPPVLCWTRLSRSFCRDVATSEKSIARPIALSACCFARFTSSSSFFLSAGEMTGLALSCCSFSFACFSSSSIFFVSFFFELFFFLLYLL